MDKQLYIDEGMRQLKDTKFYEKQDKDMTYKKLPKQIRTIYSTKTVDTVFEQTDLLYSMQIDNFVWKCDEHSIQGQVLNMS